MRSFVMRNSHGVLYQLTVQNQVDELPKKYFRSYLAPFNVDSHAQWELRYRVVVILSIISF